MSSTSTIKKENTMANEVQNHLTVVPLPEPEDLAKALELEMYGSAVPHESGNLFVEVVDGAFESDQTKGVRADVPDLRR
jgi:hypothetical protein